MELRDGPNIKGKYYLLTHNIVDLIVRNVIFSLEHIYAHNGNQDYKYDKIYLALL